MSWKKITVPKGVYLPTCAPQEGGAFKDTGCRVEPTDTIEIRPGSRLIRINGVEYQLLISTDSLRLTPDNCLILDAPKGVTLSGNGEGRAVVGRIGVARATAGATTPWQTSSRPIPDDPETRALFEDQDDKEEHEPFDPAVFHEERLTRTITLKDGSTAEVLIDPTTGRAVSNPFRAYTGIGTDPKEGARLMAEQTQGAREVKRAATAPEPARPSRLDPAPTPAPIPAPARQRASSTGYVTLNGLLQATLGTDGFPLASITYLQMPKDLVPPFTGQWTTSLEAAFARLHMTTANAPAVFIQFQDDAPTTTLTLELAQFLPPLLDAIKACQVAVVLVSPPWDVSAIPPLINYLVPHHLRIEPHPTDTRFLTATITKAKTTPCQKSASFPKM